MMQMDKRGGAAKKMGCMPAMADGGMVKPLYMADGGMVPAKPMKARKPMGGAMGAMAAMTMPKMMANGGMVQGKGGPTEDNIPAMLSAKEFVMPADTTKAIGPEVLQAIVDATHKPSGKPAMKNGRVALVHGGEADEARRRAEQAAASAQPVPAPPQAPAAPPPSAAGARQFDPVAYAANVASIPSGANSNNPVPAADGSQDSALRNTELGRNFNNATNALAPVGGAVAGRLVGAIDRLAGGGSALGNAVAGSRVAQNVGPLAVPAAGATALLAAAAPPPPPVAAAQVPQAAQRPAPGAAPATGAAAPGAAAAPAETQVAPGVFRTTGPGGVPLFFDEASRNTNASLLARGAAPSAQNQRAAEQLANVELQRSAGAQALDQYNQQVRQAQGINKDTFQQAQREINLEQAAKIKNPQERAAALAAVAQQTTADIAAPEKAADRAIEAQRVAVSGRVADADTTRANAAARLSSVEGANAETAARQLASLDAETDPVKRNRLIESIQARTGKGQTGPKFNVTTVAGGTQQSNPNDVTSPVIKAADRAFKINERTGEVEEIGAPPAPAPAQKPIPSLAQQLLKQQPGTAAQFDREYGPGAAARVLGTK